MIRRALLATTLIVVMTACVSENRPAACDEPAISLDLVLTATALRPSDPAVCGDQQVTLVIASEVDGVIHIHGYDAAVPATSVTAGEELELTFVAGRVGQFPIELHPADDPSGIGIGVFTVHAP